MAQLRVSMGVVCTILAAIAAGPVRAQGQVPKSDCRAVGLFFFDVVNLKITAVPQQIKVTYPKVGETNREVCFAWVLVGGDKNAKFDQLVLKDFDAVKGRSGRGVLKAKKVLGSSPDLISLEFDDVPDFDANKDGILEDVVVPYSITAKFKGSTVQFDPDVIIQK